jgi:hypothetical protein
MVMDLWGISSVLLLDLLKNCQLSSKVGYMVVGLDLVSNNGRRGRGLKTSKNDKRGTGGGSLGVSWELGVTYLVNSL